MTRVRVHVRLPTNLYARLCEEVDNTGMSQARIVEDALLRRFEPDHQAGFEEQILNRMNRFDVAQSRIETSVSETYETLAHFVLYWLTHTEPIQDGEREAAQALGQRRFEHFVGQVARRIAQGLG
ncbi:hypothetical protein [Hyphomonas pacifica]|jgi:predicted DNA-binding protein|uniref:hypothetical protein n=1 Tax=Hyphomonas pacifica TaxID=1280941 RepID=UPI000DBFC3A5|nr:hypothetical protein [Hyphomonas pacifica]RAN32762.1 hypothetical protein HY11_17320 [Hyphomonas pacifica]|tara:strand:- start:19336 stop:19710 length:375 start_codon:yes stop_codon:yes gene_type:complete